MKHSQREIIMNDIVAEIEKKKNEIEYDHKFKLKYDENFKYNIFVEGKDDIPFYQTHLKKLSGKDSIKPIECGGRKELIKYYDAFVKKEYCKNKNILFFIDRDYAISSIGNRNIYITKGYSVENYFVSKKLLEDIIKNHFLIYETSVISKILSYYQNTLEKFHNNTLLLNAYLKLCRKYEYINEIKERKEFKDITINKLFDISYKECKVKKELLEIIESNEYQITLNDVIEESSNFDKNNYRWEFRGKYELEFFKKFIDSLQSELRNAENGDFENKYKIKFNIYNIFTQFSNNLTTPKCLSEYIFSNIE